MSIPRWRLAIVAGALLLLSVIGAGLVQAAPTSGSTGSTGSVAIGPPETGSDKPAILGERLRALRDRLGDGRLARLRQHVVHGTFTVLDRDGELITLQVDHGTISAIGDGTITIAEAGGSSVTVATTADTKVRKNREPASLAGLAVGDEVFVHSIVEAGSARARSIVIPSAAPVAAADPAS